MYSSKKRVKRGYSQYFLNDDLYLYYQNIHSIRGKLDEVRNAIINSYYDIIMLTETWLDKDLSDAELDFVGYRIFRCDRSHYTSHQVKGGGTMIAIRDNFKCKLVNSLDDEIEQVWVLLRLKNRELLLGTIYIAPDFNREFYLSIANSFCDMKSKYPHAEMLIAGDFNLPKLLWNNSQLCATFEPLDNATARTIASATALSYAINYINLIQSNFVFNDFNSLLDLVFTSMFTIVCKRAEDCICKVDPYHPPLECLIPIKNRPNDQQLTVKWDFSRADYTGIITFLNSFDWSIIRLGDDIDSLVFTFYEIINSVIETYVPTIIVKPSSYPPWFNSFLRSKTVEKKLAHREFKRTNSRDDYIIVTDLRSECKRLGNILHLNYLEKVENFLNSNPNFFWRYANRFRYDNNILNCMHYEDVESIDLQQSVELFASFFKSVFVDNASVLHNNFEIQNMAHFNSLYLTTEEIYNGLLNLKNSGGRGPDGISNLFLKNCRVAICKPLFIIFHKSLEFGCFPPVLEAE